MHVLPKLIIILFFISYNGCGIYKPVDARKVSETGMERARKNIEEGRSVGLLGGIRGGGGGFEFASSNELWRASLDILDFMPLTSADYGGGLIITDWYSDQNNLNESVKISIRFLSNEIRTDALKIQVFSKECQKETNCKISQSNPKIEGELKVAILKRATKYKKDMVDSTPKRPLNTILTSDDKQ